MDSIDPKTAALVIQDLQNDVIIEGGAFADSGAPAHATSQNVVENVQGPRRRVPRRRCAGDPHLVHRRGGAPGLEAERAALRGREGRERARPRHLGRGAGRRARAAAGRPRRREDADERLLRDAARHPAARARRRDADHHRCVDEHVDRAHGAPRGRRRLPRDRRLRRHLDRRRRVAERGAQLRDAERRGRRDVRRDRRGAAATDACL